jgi:hypothetical protein
VTDPAPAAADIATRLRALSDPAARPVDADAVIAVARRRSRRHKAWATATVAGALAVVAGVTVPLAVEGSPTPSPGPPGRPPAVPTGTTANEFRMAPAGVTQLVVGGLPPRRPICTPAQITATAHTRATTGGVLGVIRLHGERCSLPVQHGPTALLDRSGGRLAVPVSAGDKTSPPSYPRSDIPLANGDAIWGFAWLGSYCGAPATAIQLPLDGAHGRTVSAPLSGPQPTCVSGLSPSSLIDGIVSAPGQPVQPPRPEYADLRLTGRIEPGTSKTQLAPIDLTLRTIGQSPVPLDPCPAYAGRDSATARSGGFGDPISTGYLPCTTRSLVIRPGHPLHYTVPATSLVQTPGTGAIPGSTVHVNVGIAGVPLLNLTTTAH